MGLSRLFNDYYTRLWQDGDPRLNGWPLMGTPLPTLLICATYVYFVKVAGPKFMRNRKPMDLRRLMLLYNFLMIGVSTYLFAKLGIHGWFGKYDLRCQPVDYSDSTDAMGMVNVSWLYYITKYVEFIDTIFFVLRKKNSQVSLLHVIHHGIMPISVWWGVKFSPGGHSTFFAFLNSFIHILMYTYYGLAALGPRWQRFLGWKRYMTSMQIIQFVAILVHSFQLMFRPQCQYPRGFMWWIGFHAILFLFLFTNFYRSEYIRPKKALVNNNGHLKRDADSEPLELNNQNGLSHLKSN